ncbi:MAG: TGS domain-containing protein [Candidatus Aenigmarchaeota archaeon]|nr:TGS domain-containing protein [Candidatus Aenigmarchaeota archaeon]
MPINAGPKYYAAEERFLKATSPEEKIACLEEMIREMPKHKGTENALAQLKRKLAKLRSDSQGSKKGGKSRGVEKTGDAQVCIIGFTNSGKSSLLKALTGKEVAISDKEFTTIEPEVAMMNLGGANIQLVEIPSTFDSTQLSILYSCDLILALHTSREEKQKLEEFLKKRNIRTKTLFAATKLDTSSSPSRVKISVKLGYGLDDLKAELWESLNLIRAYTKRNNKVEEVPVVLKRGSTVKHFAKEIHKDFVSNFAFARIFDKTKFSGRKVGLKYVLKEGDIVEIHTK